MAMLQFYQHPNSEYPLRQHCNTNITTTVTPIIASQDVVLVIVNIYYPLQFTTNRAYS